MKGRCSKQWNVSTLRNGGRRLTMQRAVIFQSTKIVYAHITILGSITEIGSVQQLGSGATLGPNTDLYVTAAAVMCVGIKKRCVACAVASACALAWSVGE